MSYFRFHRGLQIFPGVRLNISKTGPSVSVGPNGARVNVGMQGVRTTVGIPGSGASIISRTNWQTMAGNGGGGLPARARKQAQNQYDMLSGMPEESAWQTLENEWSRESVDHLEQMIRNFASERALNPDAASDPDRWDRMEAMLARSLANSRAHLAALNARRGHRPWWFYAIMLIVLAPIVMFGLSIITTPSINDCAQYKTYESASQSCIKAFGLRPQNFSE